MLSTDDMIQALRNGYSSGLNSVGQQYLQSGAGTAFMPGEALHDAVSFQNNVAAARSAFDAPYGSIAARNNPSQYGSIFSRYHPEVAAALNAEQDFGMPRRSGQLLQAPQATEAQAAQQAQDGAMPRKYDPFSTSFSTG